MKPRTEHAIVGARVLQYQVRKHRRDIARWLALRMQRLVVKTQPEGRGVGFAADAGDLVGR